jgi:hypothetical protein
MAVISRIINRSEGLHARATTNNDLSGGAIAGIVLGSVFGLLFILGIFWIWRFGSGVITTAKRLSRTVTDKAEKVHARANDLYTAGRDRQYQSPKLEDKAGYDDPGSESGKTTGSFTTSIPPLNIPPATYNSLGYPELSRQASVQIPRSSVKPIGPFSSGSTPFRTEKPVVLDAKQVLGLDDTTYLDALPEQSGKHISKAYKTLGLKTV